MSNRRAIIVVLATVVALVIGFHYGSDLYPKLQVALHPPPAQPKPLDGKNSISNLMVRQTKPREWTADFDYYYTGDPPWAKLRIDLLAPNGSSSGNHGSGYLQTYASRPQPGAHHVSYQIPYPRVQVETRGVAVKLLKPVIPDEVIASQQDSQVIDWPDFPTWIRDQQLAKATPQENLERARELVDAGDEAGLTEAKSILEQLVSQDPRFDEGFVELARVAMKTNWSPEGRHQAESLIDSALQIRPDSANAKILLGYVYAHQKRFAQSEALFVDAAKSNPPNLWLWVNWGELYLLQGKTDQAIVKFREALARPIAHDRDNRAHLAASMQLLPLLYQRKGYDEIESVYRQRVAEFGTGACYTTDYAQFKLEIRGDVQGAIDLARGALNQNCEDSGARRVLGMADYVVWASAQEPRRTEALNEAKVFLPLGPTAVYMLATGERSLPALKKLLASGEKIDEKDSGGMTALAYALQNRDFPAVRHLLALGAHPEFPIGPVGMPVALMPVMEGNVDEIRLLQHSGVDYSRLRFRGVSAIDYARQSGNKDVIDLLTRHDASL